MIPNHTVYRSKSFFVKRFKASDITLRYLNVRKYSTYPFLVTWWEKRRENWEISFESMRWQPALYD